MEVDMVASSNRRDVIAGLGALAAAGGIQANRAQGQGVAGAADLILFNGKITTLDRQNPEAEALAIRDGRFIGVGRAQDIMRFAVPSTQRIDLNGRRVIPGLIDSHMHIIRGA
jgi:imidazolonepropionase-like amidohydrolase